MLQASQLPWREPSRGFSFNFPSFGKGVNIDKIAEDFKVPVCAYKPSNHTVLNMSGLLLLMSIVLREVFRSLCKPRLESYAPCSLCNAVVPSMHYQLAFEVLSVSLTTTTRKVLGCTSRIGQNH